MATYYAAVRDRSVRVDGETLEQYRPDGDIECLAVADGTVLVGTVDSGVQQVEDGETGRVWPETAPERVTSLAVSPRDPAVVWAGTEPSRVFRSADGGETWAEQPGLTDLPSAGQWSFPPRPHTHHVRWIEPDPIDEGRLYVGIEAGALVIGEDGGETWRERPSGSRRDNHQLATHPEAPGRVYAAAGDGYAESSDGGETWTHPQGGLDHRYVWSVAVAPADPETVFVSAASGAHRAHNPDGEAYVYRREDGRWSVEMEGLPGPSGTGRPVLESGGGTVHALTTEGLFRWIGGEWDPVPAAWPAEARGRLPRGLVVR